MQHKSYCREERFLANEKHLLKPLPPEPFELKYYRILKVAKNNHIYLAQDKHYYSVPFAYIGLKVKVIYTRRMVRIYAVGRQIAVHIRNYSMGGYSTDKEHLCSTHKHYLDRSPDYYIHRARTCSDQLAELVKLIFTQNRHPEQLYRTCDGLLNLHRKTEQAIFIKACQIAIKHKIFSYRSILKIIENKANFMEEDQDKPALPTHKNIRGKAYYNQLPLNFNSYDEH